MRIVNLIENTAGSSGCETEHGLCFYIETERHKILMDTGASELFLSNAEKLGVDLKKVDTVVLSHGHYDHGGGIAAFTAVNSGAKIYMQKTAEGSYYSVHPGEEPRYIGLSPEIKTLAQVIRLDGNYTIDEELSIFSGIPCDIPVPSANHVLKVKSQCFPDDQDRPDREGRKNEDTFKQDDFCHEQCLVIREGDKRVLLSGCAHHGILNILKEYRRLYGSDPDFVISGFHLMHKEGYSEEDIRQILYTAGELKKCRTRFYTGHCTGTKPYEVMKRVMGDQLVYVHCGDEIALEEYPGSGRQTKPDRKRSQYMKWHKFFAWGTVICFVLTMITGYKRK